MTIIALVLFAVAAVLGAFMTVQRLQGRELPRTGVAMTHGGIAASALVLVILAAIGTDPVQALTLWAIGLFVAAALGGSFLFLGYHLRGRALPVPIVFVHAGVAIVAFVVLLAAVLGVAA